MQQAESWPTDFQRHNLDYFLHCASKIFLYAKTWKKYQPSRNLSPVRRKTSTQIIVIKAVKDKGINCDSKISSKNWPSLRVYFFHVSSPPYHSSCRLLGDCHLSLSVSLYSVSLDLKPEVFQKKLTLLFFTVSLCYLFV